MSALSSISLGQAGHGLPRKKRHDLEDQTVERQTKPIV